MINLELIISILCYNHLKRLSNILKILLKYTNLIKSITYKMFLSQ